MFMREYLIVASRGRWKDGRWVQQYECNGDGVTNTLTGVQKDNLVIELEDERDIWIRKEQRQER